MAMPSKTKVRREHEEFLPSASTDVKGGDYDHPVFKKLSAKNGEINRMTKDEIKMKLEKLNLDTRGVKEVLKKRLKSYYKKRKLAAAHVGFSKSGPQYDFYLVIDYEATCHEHNPDDYKHEIIEFPAVLIDSHKRQVIDEFHSYVKPSLNPQLSTFCTDLTGIRQMTVDRSETFPRVLQNMEDWLASHDLKRKGSFAVITDGPWDMSRFMFTQCQLSRIRFPRWARKWVNIRKTYCNFYQFRKAKIVTMLENLGMCFEGHQHSGIDDARNIGRVVIRMLEDGSELRINERIYEEKLRLVQELANTEVLTPGRGQLVRCEVLQVKSNDTNSDVEGEEEAAPAVQPCCSITAPHTDIVSGIQNTVLTDNSSVNADGEDDSGEDNDVNDLLAYYALQKR